MNALTRAFAFSAVIGAILVAAPAVHAQGYTPIYSLDFGNPTPLSGEGGVLRSRKVGFAVGYLPLVNFLLSGTFTDDNSSGTRTIQGRLLAGDATYSSGQRQPAFDIGGWYFAEGNGFASKKSGQRDLYELHARAFASARRDVGIQGAILKSTNKDQVGQQYTIYAVSEYSSARTRRRTRMPWAVQGGLGIFLDPNYDPNYGDRHLTSGPSYFVSGSLDLSSRYSLTVSQWYLRTRGQDINRVGIGIGFKL